MVKRELSKEEIRKRLIRLQNLEKLHTEQKIRIERLIEENKKIVILEKTILEQQKTIDDLKLQIEELRTMIFGKKKKIKEIDNDDDLFPPKEELEEKQRIHCKREYMKLCLIFNDLKNDRNIERYNEFTKRLKELSMIKKLDLKKLIRYKTTLRKNIPEYLTCLSDPRIPLTNNQAERSLRHLVLKKKISFGSLTKRTADNLAVLMSVLMSLKQEYQNDFFGEYLKV